MTKKCLLSYSAGDLDNNRLKGVAIPVQVCRWEGKWVGMPLYLCASWKDADRGAGGMEQQYWRGLLPLLGQVIAIWDETGHVVCGVQHVRWVTVQRVAALEVPGLGRKGSIRRQKALWYSRPGTAVKQGCPATSASHIQRYSQKQLRQGLSLAQLIGQFTTRGGAAPMK